MTHKEADRLTRLTRMVNDLIDRVDSQDKLITELAKQAGQFDRELAAIAMGTRPSLIRTSATKEDVVAMALRGCPALPLTIPEHSAQLKVEELAALLFLKNYREGFSGRPNIKAKSRLMQLLYGTASGYSSYSKINEFTGETLSDRFSRLAIALDDLFGIDKAQQRETRLIEAMEEEKVRQEELETNPLGLETEEAKQLYREMNDSIYRPTT